MRRKKKSRTSRKFSNFLAFIFCGLKRQNDDDDDTGNGDSDDNGDNDDDDHDDCGNGDNNDDFEDIAEGFIDDDDSYTDGLVYDDIDDDDDVFVTREYVSASATNIIKQHDLLEQARSQSVQGFAIFVNRKIKEMPRKKKWYKSSYENMQSTAEDRIERMLEVCNEMVVEPHAMVGFFADGMIEVVPEIEPSDHFVDHGGDGPDVEMYIE